MHMILNRNIFKCWGRFFNCEKYCELLEKQLYDLLCAVSLVILCILQQLGARPVQLYDLLVAFRLGGATEKEQIIKLGYFLNSTFAFRLGATSPRSGRRP